jgi:hypothetical protein
VPEDFVSGVRQFALLNDSMAGVKAAVTIPLSLRVRDEEDAPWQELAGRLRAAFEATRRGRRSIDRPGTQSYTRSFRGQFGRANS